MRIAAAAIRHQGVVYSLMPPARHHDVLRALHEIGLAHDSQTDQGFVTDDDVFVSRRAAYIIAEESGQLQRRNDPGSYQGPELFSEDLW